MRRTVIIKKAARTPSAVPIDTSELAVTCAGGLENLLERELHCLGHEIVRRGPGVLHCAAELADAPLLARRVRVASRVLVPLDHFSTDRYDGLYERVTRLPWERIVPLRSTFAITANTRSRKMSDHRFLAMRLKDAIVDRQRAQQGGKRSSVGRDNPVFRVVVFIDDHDQVDLSLDASGAPLHERGYRTEAGEAPLRETVAAAMLREAAFTDADESNVFPVVIDPFCGSGTIAIEAALIAARRPAQPPTRRFACERWPWFPGDASRRTPADEAPIAPAVPRIIASDNDPEVIEIARRNAHRAGVESWIEFTVGDFRERLAEAGARCASRTTQLLLVTNPPYGERLNPTDLVSLYRDLGSAAKKHLAGATLWVLCSDKSLMLETGLRASRRVPMYNGGIACRLYQIEIRE